MKKEHWLIYGLILTLVTVLALPWLITGIEQIPYRLKWHRANIDDYEYPYNVVGYIVTCGADTTVTVRNGKGVAVTYEYADPECEEFRTIPTMEDHFDWVAAWQADCRRNWMKSRCYVTYEWDYGFPVRAYLDSRIDYMHHDVTISVTHFEVLESD